MKQDYYYLLLLDENVNNETVCEEDLDAEMYYLMYSPERCTKGACPSRIKSESIIYKLLSMLGVASKVNS